MPVAEGRALDMGDAGLFVYMGQQVSVPPGAATVFDLVTGEESPLDGHVDAPVLIRYAAE